MYNYSLGIIGPKVVRVSMQPRADYRRASGLACSFAIIITIELVVIPDCYIYIYIYVYMYVLRLLA